MSGHSPAKEATRRRAMLRGLAEIDQWTLGDAVQHGGLSRPTAAKYIKLLVADGVVQPAGKLANGRNPFTLYQVVP